jgi:hypothetical protein
MAIARGASAAAADSRKLFIDSSTVRNSPFNDEQEARGHRAAPVSLRARLRENPAANQNSSQLRY